MNLRRFLNIAFYMLVEEYQRIGVNLVEATERVQESLGIQTREVAVATNNENSLKELEKMMRGVK